MHSSSHATHLRSSPAGKAPPAAMMTAYAAFLAAGLALCHIVTISETGEAMSAVITVAEMLQCLAIFLLATQVVSSGSVAGISARAVGCESLALVFRLSSHLNYNGYLPMDLSGDWFFQSVDICALVAASWLLYQLLVVQTESYQASEDSFPMGPLVLVCVVLAALLHADLNARPVFDTLWMSGLFLGSVSVLPQLWLITRNGGKVDALMCHYIAMMALGRGLAGYFMWAAREDITCNPWMDGVNHAILAILGAHLLHLVLLGDFAYHYVKAVATQGFNCNLDMEGIAIFV